MARNSLTPARSGGFIQRDLEAPFHSLHREMNRLFDDIFHGRRHTSLQASSEQYGPLMPSVDVSETDGEVRIRAELPGVNDSDIDVSLDGDVLVIRGEKKFETTDDKENYHFVERSYGTFQRALQLPCPVDHDKVRADFDNGVLTVTLPKCEEQETSRKILIQRNREQGTASASEHENTAQSKSPAREAQQSADPKPKTT